jgi:hydrogenase maturation protease
MSSSVILIGMGNDYRRDDGAGLAVARMLKASSILPHVQVSEHNGDGMSLMDAWQTTSHVFLVDAVSSGATPGTIYRFDALAQPLSADYDFHSTHAFGLAEAIELARALNQLPQRLIVYAIEGENFSSGSGLSPDVENAVNKATELLLDEMQRLLLSPG